MINVYAERTVLIESWREDVESPCRYSGRRTIGAGVGFYNQGSTALLTLCVGVRSKDDIKKGQFVDKYVGEIITAEETERRRQLSKVAQKKDVYLFELDKFEGDADRDPSLANPVFVDGEFRSGPSRFINHSCDPNLRIFARVGPHALKRFHDLAFFAIKDIPAGTELTFDYVDGADEKLEEEKRDRRKKKEMTKCLCGSDNCRGFLW